MVSVFFMRATRPSRAAKQPDQHESVSGLSATTNQGSVGGTIPMTGDSRPVVTVSDMLKKKTRLRGLRPHPPLRNAIR
jgi:hypothetical protein